MASLSLPASRRVSRLSILSIDKAARLRPCEMPPAVRGHNHVCASSNPFETANYFDRSLQALDQVRAISKFDCARKHASFLPAKVCIRQPSPAAVGRATMTSAARGAG